MPKHLHRANASCIKTSAFSEAFIVSKLCEVVHNYVS